MARAAAHRLDPLLRPRSIAVVGASTREDSIGAWTLENLQRGGFDGDILPVNPRYRSLVGRPCHASLSALPCVPDLLIFAVADRHIEALLDEAIALGIPAAVIMSTLVLDDDKTPDLRDRVRAKVQAAGMLLCGANGMGFYNVRDHVWACGFDSCEHPPPGRVSLISHSGAGMSGIVDSDERLRINLAVSTGNELGVTMDEYLDFALDLPETRAVGLFIETARNPDGFRAALQKACDRRIPVVALKVGRTARAAELTVSHSGAMAGDSAAFDALFDRYGVHAVRDMDELATLLILFAEMPLPGPGGLVSLHDSGGERQLIVDLADEAGVPLTELQAATVATLRKVVDPELPAVNPLDAWSRGGPGAAAQMADSLGIMLNDPGAALGVVAHDRAPGGVIYDSYVTYMETAQAASGKPVALVAARQGSGCDPRVVTTTQRGFPVLDGLPAFLCGVRALFEHRDFRPPDESSTDSSVPADAVSHWRERLDGTGALDEAASLAALADFGIASNPGRIAESADDLGACIAALGFPLVAKTATPGFLHKTEQAAVHLGLQDEPALRAAYDDLAERCGRRVLVAPMLPAGVEMILGMRHDPQFGPVVLLGFGGVHAELLQDVAFALPPFNAAWARRCLDRLKMRPLLDGFRGQPAVDIDAYCALAARFSGMAKALAGKLREADINPVIVNPDGAIAADALLVGNARSTTT